MFYTLCRHRLQICAIKSRSFGVSLDYLVNDSDQEEVLDNDAVKRIKEIQTLPFKEKDKIYSVIDALIRDYRTKKAYS